MSLHPTMRNDELYFITDSINKCVLNIDLWCKEYSYDPHNNEYINMLFTEEHFINTKKLFEI